MNESAPLKVELAEIDPVTVRARRTVMRDFPMGLEPFMLEVLGEIQAAGAQPAGPPILLYYDEDYNAEAVDVEIAWPVVEASLVTATLPSILAARYVHVGPYQTLEPVYEGMLAWMQANGYRPLCPMREVYPNDPRETPPEEIITEVIIPVEKL